MLLSNSRRVTIRSARATHRSATDSLDTADLAPARRNAPLARCHQGPYASICRRVPGACPSRSEWPPCVGAPGTNQRPRFLTPSGGAVRPWSSGGNGRKGPSPFQGGRALWCRGSSAERKLPRLARGKAGRQERGGSSPCEQGLSVEDEEPPAWGAQISPSVRTCRVTMVFVVPVLVAHRE